MLALLFLSNMVGTAIATRFPKQTNLTLQQANYGLPLTTEAATEDRSDVSCYTDCVPKGVKRKHASCCSGGDWHETLKCPSPAHARCPAGGYLCKNHVCVLDPSVGAGAVSRETCAADCTKPPSTPGDLKWSITFPFEIQGNVYSSSLVLSPDGVIVYQAFCNCDQACMNSRSGQANQPRGSLFAIHAASGIQRWSTTWQMHTVYNSGCSAPELVASADGTTLYVTIDESMQALQAADGTKKWTNTPDNPSAQSPYQNPTVSLDGSTVYVGCLNALCAVDTANGSNKWNYSLGLSTTTTGYPNYYSPTSASVVSPDCATVFVQNVNDDGISQLHAINAADGSKKWSLNDTEPYTQLALSADGAIVYAVGKGVAPEPEFFLPYSTIRAIHTATGSQKWNFTTWNTTANISGPEYDVTLVASGFQNSVPVVSPDGASLYVEASLDIEWFSRQRGSGPSAGGSCCSGGTYALRTSDGALRWNYTSQYSSNFRTPSCSPDGATLYTYYGGGIVTFHTADGTMKANNYTGWHGFIPTPAFSLDGETFYNAGESVVHGIGFKTLSAYQV